MKRKREKDREARYGDGRKEKGREKLIGEDNLGKENAEEGKWRGRRIGKRDERGA